MNLENLFEALSAIHPLSENFKSAIQQDTVRLSLPKDYFLLEAPKVSENAYFIEHGFAIAYTFIRGKKQIERFYGPHQIVMSTSSFFQQAPSKEFIQLVKQSDVLHISYSSLMRMLQSFPEANAIYRVVMNQCLEEYLERLHDVQHLRAAERYKKLRANIPQIEQLVPQEYVASFLGITPQSLSRMKKRIE